MDGIDAVIFDLDGVIVFTDEFHYLAWKAMADKLGIPFDRNRNNALRGVSRMESLELVLADHAERYSDAQKQQLADEKNDIYRAYLVQMTPSDLDGAVKETLDTLRAAGYKLAIGSSSKNAATILAKIGLANYFDAVSDGTNITRTKPDPEVFLKAADFLGVPPGRCVVVEDAHAGIEAGRSAGMRTAAIGDAANSETATWRIKRIADLVDLLVAKH